LQRLGRRLAGERWLLAFCVAAALLLLGTMARPLLTGRVPTLWDLGSFHLPLRDFYSRCLKNGEPFDWLPAMHNGVFITGEGEHGPYHPLHLLLYRLLPLDTAFAADAFLAYPLMLAGMFVFLRPHAGRAGALLAGLVYAFSANNIYHGIHPNFLAVMAHLPWQLWLLERLALSVGPPRWLAAAGIGLLTGSQLLLGHPQALSYSLLAEVLYALFLAKAAAARLQAAIVWGSAKVLGMAFGGVQLLSTLSFLGNSTRGSFDPLFGAFAPWRLVQMIVPNLLVRHVPEWWDEPFYFGAPAVVLLLWGLSCRREVDRGNRRLTWYALTLGVLAAWLATGHYGKLYLVQTRLPVLGQLRAPSRYVNLLAFAGTILAGLAFGLLATWVQSGRRLPWRSLLLPWLAAAAAVAAAIAFSLVYPPVERHGFDRRFLSGVLAMFAAAGCVTLAVRGRTLGLYGLVLIAALDLGQHTLKNNMWGEGLWKGTPTLAEYKAAADQPPQRRQGRILSFTSYPTYLLLRDERLVNGYAGGIEPRKRLDYLSLPALRIAGAGWYRELWVLGDTCRVAGLEAWGRWWFRVPDPLPRVRLMSQAVASNDPARDLQDLDVDHAALADRPLELDDGPAGKAELEEEHPGRLRITTESEGRRLLVVSESHDPGWEVRIDGTPAKVERVNGDFLGCVVGPGRHAVEFAFRPRPVHFGLLLSSAGLVMILLMACLAFASNRRQLARRASEGQPSHAWRLPATGGS
jgi:hypothetical protein